MKKEQDVLKKQEQSEVKGGIRIGTSKWCPKYTTCPYANRQCYYQNLPVGYVIPCPL
ncbi:MAG: hypothetical protein GY765_01940 [bacterium]|nr:hypothetical protein [bacterium]